MTAVALGVVGSAGAVEVLPPALRAIAIAAFVLGGPPTPGGVFLHHTAPLRRCGPNTRCRTCDLHPRGDRLVDDWLRHVHQHRFGYRLAGPDAVDTRGWPAPFCPAGCQEKVADMNAAAITLDRPVTPDVVPQAAHQLRPRRGTLWLSTRSPWLMLALCLVAFCWSVPSIASAPASQFGLLASASPVYSMSILLAVTGFGVAMRQRNNSAAVVAIFLMIVCQRLPRAISTDAPMYSWTYKHLGVVDYIQQNQFWPAASTFITGGPASSR